MIIIAGFLIGAVWGAIHVRRRGGNGFDIAQFMAVWAILGAILGTFATLVVERML